MTNLKIGFSIFTLFCSLSAWAVGEALPWRLIESKGETVSYEARSSLMPALKVPLEAYIGEPKLVKYEQSKQNKAIWLLIYRAGQLGTSELVQVEKAVVINAEQQKLLGEANWRFEALGKNPKAKPAQPEWIWSKEDILVKDLEFDTETRIAF